ncbi:S-layer homology domain-containing protein [Oscillospiraceae bacterium OttesenSCG-928-F05]|nr:S-layer homology domain-containing protein [Oscillospiraceae bacterium OttesenSCG-928-F05]
MRKKIKHCLLIVLCLALVLSAPPALAADTLVIHINEDGGHPSYDTIYSGKRYELEVEAVNGDTVREHYTWAVTEGDDFLILLYEEGLGTYVLPLGDLTEYIGDRGTVTVTYDNGSDPLLVGSIDFTLTSVYAKTPGGVLFSVLSSSGEYELIPGGAVEAAAVCSNPNGEALFSDTSCQLSYDWYVSDEDLRENPSTPISPAAGSSREHFENTPHGYQCVSTHTISKEDAGKYLYVIVSYGKPDPMIAEGLGMPPEKAVVNWEMYVSSAGQISGNTPSGAVIEASGSNASVSIGQSATLTATQVAGDTDASHYTWTLDSTGQQFFALSDGGKGTSVTLTPKSGNLTSYIGRTATVTVTYQGGGKTASDTVSVQLKSAFDSVKFTDEGSGSPLYSAGRKVKVAPTLTGSPAVTYQWKVSTRNPSSSSVSYSNAPGSGNNSATYTIAEADEGRYLSAALTATAGGASETRTVYAGWVTDGRTVDLGLDAEVYFSSSAARYDTYIYAEVLTLEKNPVDLTERVSFQWQRLDGSRWENISGATSSGYRPTQADVDAGYIRVVVSGVSSRGTSGSLNSGDLVVEKRSGTTGTGKALVELNGEVLELTKKDGVHTVVLTSRDLSNIAGEIGIYSENIDKLDVTVPTSSLPSGQTLTVRADCGAVTFPTSALRSLFSGQSRFTIRLREGSLGVSLYADGREIAYRGQNLTLSLGYALSGSQTENTIVCVDKTGGGRRVIPMSLLQGGSVIARVASTGRYDAVDNGKTFADVGYHWSRENIEFVTAREIFDGVSYQRFSPDTYMTRAMFAAVLARLDGADVSGYSGSYFSDVAANAWYAPYIAWAANKGIVKGVGDGRFDPSGYVTREQMALMICNYLSTTDLKLTEIRSRADGFTDAHQISGWAVSSIEQLNRAAILDGNSDGSFRPRGYATRAEAAKILTGLISNLMAQ